VAVETVSGHKKRKFKMKKNFTPGDLVVRKSIPNSEYGIVVNELELDSWVRSEEEAELYDFKNMKDSAVKVVWFWCTDQQVDVEHSRTHNVWELASRLVKAEDERSKK